MSHFHIDQEVEVDGYQDAGSYIRPILYDTKRENFDKLIPRSQECEQYVKWYCQGARLLTHSGNNKTYCRSGNTREVLIFAKRTNSRIQESHENYYYNSATKEEYKFANSKISKKSKNQQFAKI